MKRRVITSRRICWPTPDTVCLEGGCMYCNQHRYIPISWIRNYAARTSAEHLAAFAYGVEHNFFNADKRWKEVKR
jgi:hypothetical protein